MTDDRTWLQLLLERNAGREVLDERVAAALVDEVLAAFRADDFVVVTGASDDDGVCAAVLEPNGRACCLEFAPRSGREGALLRALAEATRDRGATRLWSAGPPRWYLRSGVSDPLEAAAWIDAGATIASRHFDLIVDPRALRLAGESVGVERVSADEVDAVARWVGDEFSRDWEAEARAAGGRSGLFVCRVDGAFAAFAGHSGHGAARGTFGPLGTAPAARGKGLGGRVAAAAIADLARRGFDKVVVPWVDLQVVPLYERIAAVLERRSRVLFTLNLAPPTK